MAKVEVLKRREGFIVQVTFREPFEYFFEIAVHAARFSHPRDANKLAEKVRAKVNEIGLSRSTAFALSEGKSDGHWNYESSAYRPMNAATTAIFNVPASKAALEADRLAD